MAGCIQSANPPAVKCDKFLSTAQLSRELRERHGLVASPRFLRAMVRAGGVPRIRSCARLCDVLEFWHRNPDWSPKGPHE